MLEIMMLLFLYKFAAEHPHRRVYLWCGFAALAIVGVLWLVGYTFIN